MDAEILRGFVRQAEEYLPLVRGGILVCAQSGGVYGELSATLRHIGSIKNSASILGLKEIETICARFELELKSAVGGAVHVQSLDDEDARRLLDRLAELEALVAEIHFSAGDFSENISDLLEESFGQFERNLGGDKKSIETAAAEEEFAIDAETLEVFAQEADELTRAFNCNLRLLENLPAKKNGEALLEMRRSIHTLKGSAAVVGLKSLARFAHRVEDLLDCLAERDDDVAGGEEIFRLLFAATDCFESLAANETSARLTEKIQIIYEKINEVTARFKHKETGEFEPQILNQANADEATRDVRLQSEDRAQPPKTIVRIALDKLDELVEVVAQLRANRSVFERRFAEREYSKPDNLAALFNEQANLIENIQEKLLRLRTVRFGSLAARLQRTVRQACEDEEKIAALVIDGEELEIDTQILDGFVEPLLHLLRNAVAHGIEAPDLRRLLGKSETGVISLAARTEKGRVVVTVTDDGRGISADALRETAVARGFLSRQHADRMSDHEAFQLIFIDGLTTAENLSQTAGRGVGMNVVKQSVERRGGTISIESEARRGTTFAVSLPADLPLQHAQKSLSVLIVDDSSSIRHATSNWIKNAGWQPQTAENGIEALRILNAARRLPNVILTDAEMPQMDGYAFLAAVKTRENLRSIPVVMITSRGDQAHRRKAVDLGVSDFLTKPCDEALLLERIRMLTGV